MSLRSIMRYEDPEFRELRATLSKLYPLPDLAPYRLTPAVAPRRTKNPSLVGMAFDYLLRFSLEREYQRHVINRQWTAQGALEEISKLSYFDLRRKRLIDRIVEMFRISQKTHQQYVHGGKVDPTTLASISIFLSKLEILYRTQLIHYGLDYHDLLRISKIDIRDLVSILQNCDLALFAPRRKIILNPTFGRASRLVGGADADLIIDDCIIDIKTKKEVKLSRPEYNQLLGYYLLYLIGGISESKNSKINSIGIYFARHNILWKRNIADIDPKNRLPDVARSLERLAIELFEAEL